MASQSEMTVTKHGAGAMVFWAVLIMDDMNGMICWSGGETSASAEQVSGLLHALIEIDLHVLRRAAGGDDVEAAVAIEIGEAQVFAGHCVVIDES